MKRELKSKVDLFLENKKKMRAGFRFEDEATCLLTSFLYADIDKPIDINKLVDSQNIIRDNTNIFSDYRFISLIVASKMAMHSKPEDYFKKVNNYSKKLKEKRKISSLYSILTSMILSDYNGKINDNKYIEKEKRIFNLMNKKHPILTSEDDIPFTMLLALSDKNEKNIVDESEECYLELKKNIKHSKDACQAMANILVLSDKEQEDKTKKILEIYSLLKKHRKNIEDKFVLTVLATLIFVDKDSKDIVNDIIEVDNYIGCKKGAGLWPYGKLTRLLFAILLVESTYGNETFGNTKNSIAISAVVAEQVITLILVMSMLLLMD